MATAIDLEDISSEDSSSPTARSCTKDFVQSFSKMFDTDFLTDITIVVNGIEIKAHKFVLAARSDVFRAMFEHNPMEQQQSRIIMKDIDYDVAKEMLRFMYTATTPKLDSLADSLLIAAERYDLQKLKERCEKKLIADLCVINASDTLILADKHNAKHLEQTTMEFIDKHYREVRRTDGWLRIDSSLLRKLFDVSKNISTPSKARQIKRCIK